MQTDAHPDDEDNGLLAMLGHGRGMRTTLVTLTRGDGGQNEIGPEIGQALGVLRTEELLARAPLRRRGAVLHARDRFRLFVQRRGVDREVGARRDPGRSRPAHPDHPARRHRRIPLRRHRRRAASPGVGAADASRPSAPRRIPRSIPNRSRKASARGRPCAYFCTDETSFAPQPPPRTPDLADAGPLGLRSGARPDLRGARRSRRGRCTSARARRSCCCCPGSRRTAPTGCRTRCSIEQGVAPNDLFDGIDVTIDGPVTFRRTQSPAALKQRLERIAGRGGPRPARAGAERTGRSGSGACGRLQSDARSRSGPPSRRQPCRGRASGRRQGGAHIPPRQKQVQFLFAILIAGGVRLEALADDGVVTPGQSVNVSAYAVGTGELRSVTLSGFDGQRCVMRRRSRQGGDLQGECDDSGEYASVGAVLDAASGGLALRLRAGRPLRSALPPVAVPRHLHARDRRRRADGRARGGVPLQQSGGGGEALGTDGVAGVQRHGRSGDRDRPGRSLPPGGSSA